VAAGLALPRVFTLVQGIWGLIYGITLLVMAFRGTGWGAGIVGGLGIIFGIALMPTAWFPGWVWPRLGKADNEWRR